MKNLNTIMKVTNLIGLIGLVLLSCKADSINTKPVEKTIRYKETVTLSATPASTLTFAEVTDSRCPEGAQCIWAGNVIVDLELKPSTASTTEGQSVKMCLGDCKTLYPNASFRETDTVRVNLQANSYKLILTKVAPYPNVSKQTSKSDYTLSLKVEEVSK